jgi:hypothetical protein
MAAPIGSAGRRLPPPFRLTSGLDLLDRWSEQATQIEKNVVHQVLLAVVDRSVFTDHFVVNDATKTMEFFVLAKCELAVKIRVNDLGTGAITYIGPICAAPGLDRVAPAAGSPRPAENRPEKPEDAPYGS